MRWIKTTVALMLIGAWGLACTGDNTSPVMPDDGWKPPLTATFDLGPGDVGQCMGDDAVSYPANVSGFGADPLAFNCTANDIRIANARTTAGTPIQCVQGQVIGADIIADVEQTSTSARTDIGIWIGNNGKT